MHRIYETPSSSYSALMFPPLFHRAVLELLTERVQRDIIHKTFIFQKNTWEPYFIKTNS